MQKMNVVVKKKTRKERHMIGAILFAVFIALGLVVWAVDAWQSVEVTTEKLEDGRVRKTFQHKGETHGK